MRFCIHDDCLRSEEKDRVRIQKREEKNSKEIKGTWASPTDTRTKPPSGMGFWHLTYGSGESDIVKQVFEILLICFFFFKETLESKIQNRDHFCLLPLPMKVVDNLSTPFQHRFLKRDWVANFF